jgi:hypothetical protein
MGKGRGEHQEKVRKKQHKHDEEQNCIAKPSSCRIVLRLA